MTDSLRNAWLKCVDACAGTDGSEILEFAVSLPLLIVIAIGVTDFGAAFNLKYKLHNAVGAGARFASNQTTSDLTNPTPTSTKAIHDVIHNYLSTAKINDCGLFYSRPNQVRTDLDLYRDHELPRKWDACVGSGQGRHVLHYRRKPRQPRSYSCDTDVPFPMALSPSD